MCPTQTGPAPPPYTAEDPAGSIRPAPPPTPRSYARPARETYEPSLRSPTSLRPQDNEQTPLLEIRANSRPKHPCYNCVQCFTLIFIVLQVLVLAATAGAYLDRSLSQDTADPRVRDRIRKEWEAEERTWLSKVNDYKARASDALRRLSKYEQELEDKKRRETRRMAELKLYWGEVQPGDRCVGDGAKIYSAKLENFDWSIDAFTACRATPMVINGITYEKPDHCEVKGRNSGVLAVWNAKGIPECSAYWEGMKDAGCTAPGSRTRRFEAHLSGVWPKDEAEAMAICFSTPMTIHDQLYERPISCPHFLLAGYYGVWEVPDMSCI